MEIDKSASDEENDGLETSSIEDFDNDHRKDLDLNDKEESLDDNKQDGLNFDSKELMKTPISLNDTRVENDEDIIEDNKEKSELKIEVSNECRNQVKDGISFVDHQKQDDLSRKSEEVRELDDGAETVKENDNQDNEEGEDDEFGEFTVNAIRVEESDAIDQKNIVEENDRTNKDQNKTVNTDVKDDEEEFGEFGGFSESALPPCETPAEPSSHECDANSTAIAQSNAKSNFLRINAALQPGNAANKFLRIAQQQQQRDDVTAASPHFQELFELCFSNGGAQEEDKKDKSKEAHEADEDDATSEAIPAFFETLFNDAASHPHHPPHSGDASLTNKRIAQEVLDFDQSPAHTYQWRFSHSFDLFLKSSLSIDYRYAIGGDKPGMPPPHHATHAQSHAHAHTQPSFTTHHHNSHSNNNSQSLANAGPPSFDWAHSGLRNPLPSNASSSTLSAAATTTKITANPNQLEAANSSASSKPVASSPSTAGKAVNQKSDAINNGGCYFNWDIFEKSINKMTAANAAQNTTLTNQNESATTTANSQKNAGSAGQSDSPASKFSEFEQLSGGGRPNGTSNATTNQNASSTTNQKELNLEVASLLAQLPDLGYLSSKVLIFPQAHTNSQQPDPMPTPSQS